MRSLKERLQAKLVEALSVNDFDLKQWDSNDLNDVLSKILKDSNDLRLFIGNYDDKIDEYSLEFTDPDYEGIAGLENYQRKFDRLDADFDALIDFLNERIETPKIQEADIFWYNSGNGLRTICIDSFTGKKSFLHILGKDDLHRVLDEVKSFKPEISGAYLY